MRKLVYLLLQPFLLTAILSNNINPDEELLIASESYNEEASGDKNILFDNSGDSHFINSEDSVTEHHNEALKPRSNIEAIPEPEMFKTFGVNVLNPDASRTKVKTFVLWLTSK